MAMEEGTYVVPGTPAPAPRPVLVSDVPVAASRPVSSPAPPLPAAVVSQPPVIAQDCNHARATAAPAQRASAATTPGRLTAAQNVSAPRPFVPLPSVEDAALRE